MDSVFFILLLPVLLAVMMMGLGLSLTVQDFARVTRYPKIIVITLFTQLIILNLIAFLICVTLDLPPLIAVGLMLLAASPGGPTANLFSYLYQGDVALNITMTAFNTLISIFTLPFITNLALVYFLKEDQAIHIPTSKIMMVFLITVIPVIIGMLIREVYPIFAEKALRPMRMLAVIFLCSLFAFALFQERSNLMTYFQSVGIATALFCFTSLFIGYCIPLLIGVEEHQARACTFEIGIHNTAIAMTIALSVLGSATIAMPAGIYTIVMYLFASLLGYLLSRQRKIYTLAKQSEAQ